MVNTTMWVKALKIIPQITKEEWKGLDIISRWLIASRAAVFIMTALAGAIGGLLAYRNGSFSWHLFALSVLGIVLAHATNNMLNDYVDHTKGVDKDNYFRSQYGPQALEHGLLTKSGLMGYIVVTGLIASLIGSYLILVTGWSALWLFLAGMLFLLFYTWPLKYYGLGEPSVILVWGPLMVGGTYFVVSGGHWDNWVVLVSLVYALGPTTVLFGKHTDKLEQDKKKGIYTLPVVIGQKAARYSTIVLWVMQYVFIFMLVFSGKLGISMLLVLLALPQLISTVKVFLKQRPLNKPEGKDGEGWPLYLVSHAFIYNRRFGLLFLLGLILDVIFFKTGILQIF
ncbi:MAG: prenyltransferase [Bacteroidetes bacterium]|nr:prenyltransferase [Bacteroidota bacterium]